MARAGTRSPARLVDILEDSNAGGTAAQQATQTPNNSRSRSRSNHKFGVLAALSSSESQTRSPRPSSWGLVSPVSELTSELKSFHLDEDPIDCDGAEHSNSRHLTVNKPRGSHSRPSLAPDTFATPEAPAKDTPKARDKKKKHRHSVTFDLPGDPEAQKSNLQQDPAELKPLERAASELPSSLEQITKHQAGQYQWVLSIPPTPRPADRRSDSSDSGVADMARSDRTVHYGCNLLYHRPASGRGPSQSDCAADVFTLLATPIQSSPEQKEQTTAEEDPKMTTTDLDGKPVTKPDASGHQAGAPSAWIMRPGLRSERSGSEDSLVENVAHQPPAKSSSRIEDSFEALDKFEEEVEAVTAAAQLQRVLSPEEAKAAAGDAAQATPGSARKSAGRPSSSAAKRPASKQGSVRGKDVVLGRTSSVRRTDPSSTSAEDDKGAAKTPARKPVPRPASLAPPKPLQKTSKPPTLSTFELPGEAVARRLKEQRQARLSMQSEQLAQLAKQVAAATAPTPQRSKSVRSKPPTIPMFELPGEAISRRKREEHAARLKVEDEAQRARREFKAKPIRASLGGAPTIVRETLTSRARTAAKATGQAEGSASSRDAAKRQSLVLPPLSRPSLSSAGSNTTGGGGPPSRGRGAELDGTSRATSSSNGSAAGGAPRSRSSVSAEDAHHQRLRGMEVLKRDNTFKEARERERRERELAAKLARQEAAERSRALSREWAEKQRLKRNKMVASAAATAAGPA